MLASLLPPLGYIVMEAWIGKLGISTTSRQQAWKRNKAIELKVQKKKKKKKNTKEKHIYIFAKAFSR